MEITHKIEEEIAIIDIGYELGKDEAGADKATGVTELDIDNHFVFLEAIEALVDQGNTNIITNLENVSYIDSSGLGALFDGYRKTTAKNGSLKICCANKDVKRVLEITKISKKIDVLESLDEAISSFN